MQKYVTCFSTSTVSVPHHLPTVPRFCAFLACLFLISASALAQFPGMSEAAKPVPKPSPASPAAAPQSATSESARPSAEDTQSTAATVAAESEPADGSLRDQALRAVSDRVGDLHRRFLDPDSPYRSIIITIMTLLILLWLRRRLTRFIEELLRDRAYDPANVRGFMRVWKGVWNFVIAVLVVIAMSGSFRLLGLTAGFIGMMLGWSLQQPVTGLAAWLMIVLKRPFRVGDRIIVAGYTGDVTGITLTHVVLNQVGGSIGGEERSGRGILIPNAILFQNTIINYTLEQEYMLDEVPVRLTFDSDYELARDILIRAAGEITSDIVQETGQAPFVRIEFMDWCLLVRLRFHTIPVQRQEISTKIIEILLRRFGEEYPRIRFAVPMTQIRYRPDEGQKGREAFQIGSNAPGSAQP